MPSKNKRRRKRPSKKQVTTRIEKMLERMAAHRNKKHLSGRR
jgi:hypothetical protein